MGSQARHSGNRRPMGRTNIDRLAGLMLMAVLLFGQQPTTTWGQTSSPMVRVKIDQRPYVGLPLSLEGQQLALLRRDGRLSRLTLDPNTTVVETVADSFVPYSPDQMKRRLEREFGSRYQVTPTEHFLVVHPPGQAQSWARPFQNHYLQLAQYFQMRGVSLERPQFPLVAVVLRSRAEFDRFLRDYHDYNSELVGYYSPVSNRVITYDRTEGRDPASMWRENGRTIIHEATHQIAFNTGLHRRFQETPRWVSEGLAMYFEALGLRDPSRYSRPEHRLDPGRLAMVQTYYRQGKLKGLLESMVVSDDPFRHDPQAAYALSWGLTYYLAETMPDRYSKFLRQDLPPDPNSRARQFAKTFGRDLGELDARLKAYLMALEIPR